MYRTKTYLAGDWTGNKLAIEQMYEWKHNKKLTLDFVNVHDFKQARDSSLNCNIKKSLRERMNITKTFILIVGNQTKSLQSGSCRYCEKYSSYLGKCNKDYSLDFRSFVDYECDIAVKDYNNGLLSKIIVLYYYANVDKTKCPDVIKNYGTHLNMYYKGNDGKEYWNYQKIKELLS